MLCCDHAIPCICPVSYRRRHNNPAGRHRRSGQPDAGVQGVAQRPPRTAPHSAAAAWRGHEWAGRRSMCPPDPQLGWTGGIRRGHLRGHSMPARCCGQCNELPCTPTGCSQYYAVFGSLHDGVSCVARAGGTVERTAQGHHGIWPVLVGDGGAEGIASSVGVPLRRLLRPIKVVQHSSIADKVLTRDGGGGAGSFSGMRRCNGVLNRCQAFWRMGVSQRAALHTCRETQLSSEGRKPSHRTRYSNSPCVIVSCIQ